ncbi:MAG TPA: F0F1 ATP synthase subunit A [Dongiaceae bacterium]|nr:F0F1 ATP synthase subunit A [Dongiaceae bacterium]
MAGVRLNPLEQFTIEPIVPIHIGAFDASFTNSSLWMAIIVIAITLVILLGMSRASIVPGRLQSAVELLYDFIANMLKENVGSEGRKYFPFVFSLFMFVLFANLIGLVPGAFTVTSHIVVTFALAIMVFIIATIIGFVRHGTHFFGYFVPKGAPLWLLPLMIPIEIISYCIRPLSLSIRLFANMVAGHVMLVVVGAFVYAIGIWMGWLPLAFITAMTGLEFLIACLQAYVFAILTCIYLNDSINLSH